MARFVIVFIVLATLMITIATARPVPTEVHGLAESPSSNAPAVAEGPATAPEAVRRRHRTSTAGGEVIIGGLATAILATIFCYIRVTRRRSDNGETTITKA
ncbi:hypothetical protein QJS10_CPA01g01060 [Acorus calamus]|uniref:Uncharacterized protein n=1 Tax=Acorus calamus TaxID=4465 RepID=A0AAV9FJY5_ACOCL|nr:hypothetical protein QJS10_CPA01g01060 [Acorus calamus]